MSRQAHVPAIDVDMGLVDHPHLSRMPDTGEGEEAEVAAAKPVR